MNHFFELHSSQATTTSHLKKDKLLLRPSFPYGTLRLQVLPVTSLNSLGHLIAHRLRV